MNKPNLRKMLARSGAIASVMAVAAGVAVASGAGVPTASAGGDGCDSGYMCVFDQPDNANGYERDFSQPVGAFTTWQWGSYTGGWHLIPYTTIDQQISAINYNWNVESVTFYSTLDSEGNSVVTCYKPGQQGYRNWSAGNNEARSDTTGYECPAG